MAVTKLKAYHSKQAINNALNYIEDSKKTTFTRQVSEGPISNNTYAIHKETENALNYSMNPAKTTVLQEENEIQLVSGWRVKPSLATEMFTATAELYYRNGHKEQVGKKYKVKTLLRAKLDTNGMPILDENGAMIHDATSPVWHDAEGNTITFDEIRTTKARTSFMWVMAFPPKEVCGYEIDPKLIHQIGIEYMSALEEATQLSFQAVISTHIDKAHLHNHILQNAYSLDGHHKYVDTMDTLKMARTISDQLSLKYHLPIILEPGQGHSMNWNEWKLAQEGKSWKDTLRKEIEYAASKAVDYQDFIRHLEASGYRIRETTNHFTYYTPGNTHRCRDTGLGSAYTKTSIQALYEQTPLYQQVQQEVSVVNTPTTPSFQDHPIHPKPLRIYVARYTKNGRRRSDLEMLLLKAIKIIKILNDRFHEPDIPSKHPCNQTASVKIQSLTEALGILQTLHIQTAEELEHLLTTTVATYSHFKKEYTELVAKEQGLTTVKELLEDFAELKQWAETIGITDLCLIAPKQKEIRKERATLFPMTPTQRRELYLSLQKHPMYKTTVSYHQLTYMEAKDCIDFLTGKRKEQPSCITTTIPDTEYSSINANTTEKSNLPSSSASQASEKILEPTQDIVDHDWTETLQKYSYEDRCFAEEYRQKAKQLMSFGYDLTHLETSLQDINNQQNEIYIAKQQMDTAKQEYKTLKQLKLYCTLAQSNPSFVYGNCFQEALQKIETIEENKEHQQAEDIIPPNIRQFSRSESIDI